MDPDKWTETKCLQLIQLFKEKPILWDQRHPLFYRKKKKPAAWEEIADAFGIFPGECRQKVLTLMSSFRREKAKMFYATKRRCKSKHE